MFQPYSHGKVQAAHSSHLGTCCQFCARFLQLQLELCINHNPKRALCHCARHYINALVVFSSFIHSLLLVLFAHVMVSCKPFVFQATPRPETTGANWFKQKRPPLHAAQISSDFIFCRSPPLHACWRQSL